MKANQHFFLISLLFAAFNITSNHLFAQTFTNSNGVAAGGWNATLTKQVVVSGLQVPLTPSFGLIGVNINMGSATGLRYNLNNYSITLTSPIGATWTVMPANTMECLTFAGNPNFDPQRLNINYRSDNGALTYPNAISCAQNGWALGEPWDIGYYKISSGQTFASAVGTNPNGAWTVTITETGSATGMQFNSVSLLFGNVLPTNSVSGQTAYDACSGALCLDEANAITATNNGFSEHNYATDPRLYLISGCQWNGDLNNTAWFKFRPTATTSNVSISGLTMNMQAIVVKPANASTPCGTSGTQANAGNSADWIVPTGGSPCAMNTLTGRPSYANGSYTNMGFNLSNLTPNEWIYLVVDGVGGNISPLYIETTGTRNCACTLTASANQDNAAACSPLASGAATATASNGTSPFTYSWDNGATTANPLNLLAGIHTVTITDAASCTATATVNITQLTAPVITAQANPSPACNGVPINFNATSGAISYQWTGPNFNQSIQNPSIAAANSGLNNGTYTVSATFAGNCISTANTTVNVITQLNGQAQNNGPACIGNNVSLTATGGNNYTWAGPNSFTSNTQNPTINSATAAASGVYTVTVTGFGACSSVATTQVTVTPCASCDDSGCKGANLVQNADFALGNVGFTTNYIPNNTNATCTPGANCNGQYMCQYGYAITNSATPCNPTWSSSIQDHTPTGNGNFMLVDFPTGVAPNNIWCQNITLAANTDYCMGAYFMNLLPLGNTSVDPRFQFSKNNNINANVFSVDNDEQWQFKGISYNSGAGGAVTFCIQNANYGTVGYDVALDDISVRPLLTGANPIAASDNANICTPTTSTTINVLANDTGGTGVINPASISIYQAPPFSQGTAVVNPNNTITFTANPAFTTGTTNFTYQVCNTSGCCSTASVSVAMGVSPSITTTATNTNCGVPAGSATAVFTSGNPSFLWSNGGTTATINGLAVGTYTVTATFAVGCTATATAQVQLQGVPVISTSVVQPRCGLNNGSATASMIIGIGVNYAWSNGNTGATINNLAQGIYTVTASGTLLPCSVTATVTINAPTAAAVVSINNITNSTCGLANGSLSAALTNGGGNFQWSNNVFTPLNGNISAGTYTVTATASNGCTAIASQTITTSPVPQITIAQTPTTCGNGGSLTMNVTNGVAISALQWETTPVITTATLPNPIIGTTYTVDVITADGCTATASVVASGTPAPIVTMIPQNATCGQANGQIAVTTAVTPTIVSWSGGNNSNPFVALAGGTYTATVTDGNNCSVVQSATVATSTGLQLTGVNSYTDCNGLNGNAAVTVVGNNNFLSFLWSNNETTQSIFGLTAGNYTVTVTQQFPTYTCSASVVVTVTDRNTPTITENNLGWATCGQANGTISILLSGGQTSNYNYSWSNGQATATLSNVLSGSYTVTITPIIVGSCSIVHTVNIPNNGTPITINLNTTQTSCGLNNGTIIAATNNTNTSFAWSYGTNTDSIARNLSAGIYTVTVTTSVSATINGCTATASTTIVASAFPFTSTTTATNTACGQSNGSATTVPFSNANLLYTYLWSNTQTTQTINNIPAGIYTVTITSNDGCTLSQNVTVQGSTSNMTANFATIPVIYQGQSVNLNVITNIPATSYLWNNGANTNPATVTPASNSVYTVTATSANGCTATASINVIVNEVKWNIPTIFTPNGNGENDSFYPVTYGGIEIIKFEVYNRWGQLLHSNPNRHWDGEFENEIQPIDTYIYKVDVKMPDGTTEQRVGDFLLLR